MPKVKLLQKSHLKFQKNLQKIKNLRKNQLKRKLQRKKLKKNSRIKIVTLKGKDKWITKKKGKYTVKARVWKIFSGIMGYYYDVDVILLKNGKQQKSSKYLSKYRYKENGKWKWQKWRHGKVDHAYHRYSTSYTVNKIKVKWKV